MTEAAIVLGLVLTLMLVGTLAVSLAWTTFVLAGVALMALGFVVGVPTGVYYHVVLYRCLAPRGPLPRGWLWSPVRLHTQLFEHERRAVMRWFYLGGSGFALIVLGGALVGLGVAFSE
jgi:hypothetical protein